MSGNTVSIWEENVTIPTYLVGNPNKNPMFLEKRVYQGSSGVVYPHQVIDKIFDEKVDQNYDVVFLENEYLKIMVMPSLGGRIQMAYDKQNDYHFVYYNQVIKPALVGLTGPWVSGGIEFNWPQHHRPSTFLPVDYTIENNEDGSKTLWLSEVEVMTRIKGMAGLSLHPDKAYLEIKGKVYNRTDSPKTFLWWANPALVVNDDYQSVFPPDVYAVMDHGKRDVSRFPIAFGTYYKMDYSAGVDISRYKNIKVPTSYMVHKSEYDFIGGYDHGRNAGMLHVADHHISPGKKQWVWGSGDFGRAWDRNLTDEDGPYAELMTGVYTDNQPDFTWLQPYEQKEFLQYFMPYKTIGVVSKADKDRAISLNIHDGKINAGVYISTKHEALTLVLKISGKRNKEDKLFLTPGEAWTYSVALPEETEPNDVMLELYENEICLISYSPEKPKIKSLPEKAEEAPKPGEIHSIEELYLTGLHIEQYRHATRRPEDYYLEALKRDKSDIRCNNAYGRFLMRRCKFTEAEQHFKTAVAKITKRNPNPYNGESHYNLGLALFRQDKLEEAFDVFYKSIWCSAYRGPGFYMLGVISCRKEDWLNAEFFLTQALVSNYHNHKARSLMAVVYRKLGMIDKSTECLKFTQTLDKCDWWSLYELSINDKSFIDDFKRLMRDDDNNYLELSIDYMSSGFYREALGVLDILLSEKGADRCSPLLSYHSSWLMYKLEDPKFKKAFQYAAELCPDGCFPSKTETLMVLNEAVKINPEDGNAFYYLGNLHYGLRNHKDGINAWKLSIHHNDSFPTAHRNLALALMNIEHDQKGCRRHLEKAFELDPSDSRVLFELDQLYKKLNKPLIERCEFLEDHWENVLDRDDLYLEYITLLNGLGRYSTALEKILARQFHPWEGGEGKVPEQYKRALIGLAVDEINLGNLKTALEQLNSCRSYPHNLGEGKLYGTLENDIDFLTGVALQGLGEQSKAETFFNQATQGPSEPVSAMFYNDQPPHMIFYQALAFRALNKQKSASSRFNKLIDYGENHLNDQITIDYFAVSLPDFLVFDVDLNKKNQIHCLFMMALGHAGAGQQDVAYTYVEQILAEENYHIVPEVLNFLKIRL